MNKTPKTEAEIFRRVMSEPIKARDGLESVTVQDAILALLVAKAANGEHSERKLITKLAQKLKLVNAPTPRSQGGVMVLYPESPPKRAAASDEN